MAVVDALLQARECLSTLSWIASVDSALHLGQLSPRDVGVLRDKLPRAGRDALRLMDGAAESGLESIVRALAEMLGFHVRSQVKVPGVGFVDLIIEEWIAVETDGTAFHDTALAPRDRRRDATLIARGRSVVRPGYSLIVHDLEAVARQIIGGVESHRRVHDSGRLAARARIRLKKLALA